MKLADADDKPTTVAYTTQLALSGQCHKTSEPETRWANHLGQDTRM